MADLFSITAPLAIRFPNGEKQIMIERIAYKDGLAFLPTFWTEHGIAHSLRIIAGPIKGEGPWKIGDAVIAVLGCHGTDPDLAREYSYWQNQLDQRGDRYPDREEIARRIRFELGANQLGNVCR